LQLMFEILFTLAQRLGKLHLLPIEAVFFFAGNLLQIPGGVLAGLLKLDRQGISLLFQRGFRRIAGVQGFLQVMVHFS
jgi:hypothetical protein